MRQHLHKEHRSAAAFGSVALSNSAPDQNDAADLAKLAADKAAGADDITLGVDSINLSIDGASQTGGVYGEIGGGAFTIYDWIFDFNGQSHDAAAYPEWVGQEFYCGCAGGVGP